MLGLTVFLFMEDVLYGAGGVLGIIAFFIGYSISGDMIVAPRDYWRLSKWDVFMKKLGYGMSAFALVLFLASGILAVIFR